MTAARPSVTVRELPRGEAGPALADLLGALRPGLTRAGLGALVTTGHDEGLRYLLARVGEQAAGAAGYRVLTTSRGRVLYVDDLVTAPALRSRGVAGVLMDELRRRGAEAGCDRLELDSGVTNTGAHRFYLRHRFDIRALHFAAAL